MISCATPKGAKVGEEMGMEDVGVPLLLSCVTPSSVPFSVQGLYVIRLLYIIDQCLNLILCIMLYLHFTSTISSCQVCSVLNVFILLT